MYMLTVSSRIRVKWYIWTFKSTPTNSVFFTSLSASKEFFSRFIELWMAKWIEVDSRWAGKLHLKLPRVRQSRVWHLNIWCDGFKRKVTWTPLYIGHWNMNAWQVWKREAASCACLQPTADVLAERTLADCCIIWYTNDPLTASQTESAEEWMLGSSK